jgi:aryl-alcohol dehydrogenase-like predicted oxidoreductase
MALRDSLERLQTDHLDMYGLHNPKLKNIRDDSIFNMMDSFIADETIKTYQVALGPAIGWTQEGLEAMDRPNLSAVQTVYNILEQTPGNELMRKAEEKNVGILVRVPEASGILTGKVNADTKFDENDHRSVRKIEWLKASLQKVEQLKPIAERNGLNITEFAMKYMMTKKGFASVLPTMISEEEVINYAEMADGKYISDSDMKEVEELYNTWPSYELKATPQAN